MLALVIIAAFIAGCVAVAAHVAARHRRDKYLSLDELLALLEGDNAQPMRDLVTGLAGRYERAAGSSANHQAWPGGLWDHLTEAGNVARVTYRAWSQCRPLPFTLPDALLVLFAHDLEKAARYRPDGTADPALGSKDAKSLHRDRLLADRHITLTAQQANALRYCEGVRDPDYSPGRRTMGPLAAFVHCCDLASARVWFNHPLPGGDPWAPAQRRVADAASVTLAPEPLDADGRVRSG